ncbi:hypothetical protein BKH43_04050 [Helicobacter sp. 13S00401-1]|uniref:thiamine phosphate synthase n=1 Tax=Helicobacter sp. 13S00401-1 TaxID=1905758 RepID=UPI000BDAFD44|nr:thiamine phosphate synthase [Helicobacter sp. 13S00401-1]PAF50739.1 hypothetical protein BKH43_04050 [Helicobacter sp. 13S00401-1]
MFGYLITSPLYHPNNSPLLFKSNLLKAKAKGVKLACFRLETKSEDLDSKQRALLDVFLQVCKEERINPFVNFTYLQTSLDLLEEGVKVGLHLKEKFLTFLESKTSHSYHLDSKVEIICSVHDQKAAFKALSLGASFVTLSPLFATPNKGTPKGIEYFKSLPLELKSKTIALGGINDTNLELVKSLGVAGFGAIRYFLE